MGTRRLAASPPCCLLLRVHSCGLLEQHPDEGKAGQGVQKTRQDDQPRLLRPPAKECDGGRNGHDTHPDEVERVAVVAVIVLHVLSDR